MKLSEAECPKLRVLIFILALMVPGAAACSRDRRPLNARLQAAVDEGLRKYGVKGASAALIFPDQSIRLVAGGVSHDTVPMQPDMLFAIGSITKNVVAALVFQLAQEGVLSLEDPLHKWLPAYPKVDGAITIRQLLAHTSGLYMFWENQKIWDDLIKYRDRIFTPEDVLSYLKDPHFSPGKGFRYSNTNYLLLAMIITRATGASLSAEFRRRFWQPLGLNNAYLSMEEQIPDRLAHVWGDNFENDGSFRDITLLPRASHESITYGSAGLFMTAEDLARWCHLLFEGKVLRQASLDEMLTIGKGGYGLGVQVFRKDLVGGQKAIGHGGANIGTAAYMMYLPEHRLSIVLMINAFKNKCLNYITGELVSISTEYLSSQTAK
jgi:D-alanyl-D-alanine carboxypeptidase